MSGWIGVDLDATLARYDGFRPDGSIGDPVPRMLVRVKQWLAEGREVRIVTARVAMPIEEASVLRAGTMTRAIQEQRELIEAWCLKHLGQKLKVTSQKDYGMIALYDDRCYRVIPNTGLIVGEDLPTG